MRGSALLVIGLLLSVQPAPSPARTRQQVADWVGAHQQPIVDELVALLSIPNVAADRANILRNVAFLDTAFAKRGFATRRLETTGNPLFFAERKTPGATKTTLIYAHVDGQPVDPKAWNQPDPFSPVIRGDRLYARSASDDKSPIIATLAALDALAASGLQPSTHLKVIIDTEEEASSPSLVPAVKEHRDLLAADMMLIFDGPIHSSGRPTLAFGARGIVTADLTVYGPKSGVHSGNYGNWVPNPALALSRLLASMKDDEGRVTVEGYYDEVVPLTSEERALLAGVPDDAPELMRVFGIAGPERAGRSLQEGLQEPTLNIRGLASAHVGAGARTIIPDRAVAAIDVRLVKETSGARLMARIADHIRRQGFHLVDREPTDAERAAHAKLAWLDVGIETPAFRTSPLLPESRALAGVMASAFGAPPVQIRTLGGTVPIAPFVDALQVPAVIVPIVNFDNNQHEENENLRLGHLFKGIEIIAAALTR
jgi:acetylornithine deacetylase/succinyl-diaminopimelate desuccinylase-like protein